MSLFRLSQRLSNNRLSKVTMFTTMTRRRNPLKFWRIIKRRRIMASRPSSSQGSHPIIMRCLPTIPKGRVACRMPVMASNALRVNRKLSRIATLKNKTAEAPPPKAIAATHLKRILRANLHHPNSCRMRQWKWPRPWTAVPISRKRAAKVNY